MSGVHRCKLYKKERRKFYSNLDLRKIKDNNRFWTTIKPFLSNKTAFSQKISLKDDIITDDKEVGNISNKHFTNSVRTLADKGGCSAHVLDINNLKDPVENIIQRFQYHPSISAIKEKICGSIFHFNTFTTEDFVKEINQLDPKKSSTGISISIRKENVDVCAPKLTEIFDSCISKGIFPDELKVADIAPIFKSVDSTAKKS